MCCPLKTAIYCTYQFTQPPHRQHRETQQKVDYVSATVTENDLIPLTSDQTKLLSQTVMYKARTIVLGCSFRFQKTPLTYIHDFKESFSYSCKSYSQAPIRKKKCHANFPQMLHCGSVQTKFLTYFKRRVFSPRMPPSVTITFHPFFMALILNAGIKEASKSWREADVWWRWHRWNEAHFSPDQPTSLFSTSL